MDVNFDVLNADLSEVEMALLMAINVTMNAALVAGANPSQMVTHFAQHEANFAALGKPKARHIMAACEVLTRNVAGLPIK